MPSNAHRRRLTHRPAYSQSRHRVRTADDPSDDDLVWSQLSASDVLDLGRVVAGVAQQLTSERVRNLQSECLSAFDNLTVVVCVSYSAKHFRTADSAAYVCTKCSKAPTKFTAANNMDPGAVPEVLQDLTTMEQMLIARVAPVMSVMRLSEYRGGQWHSKVMSFAFLRTSSLLYQFCPVSPLMFLYYVANSLPTLTLCVNFASAIKGCTTQFSGSWSTTATIRTLAFRSRTSNNYPKTAHYSCG